MQSSALPLGHAAKKDTIKSFYDLNSKVTHSLLFICNGHGEDVIASEIIKRLLKKIKNKNIEVLPLVGNGDVFNSIKSKKFRKIGYLKELPSGGFSNQSPKGFVLDLFAGFLIYNLRNFLLVKKKHSDSKPMKNLEFPAKTDLFCTDYLIHLPLTYR